MITRMKVRNFKALRDVQVDLCPFTVLIGLNDTGKTSFLEAVYALAESTRVSLANCFWSPWQHRELVHRQAADTTVEFTAALASSPPTNNGKASSQGVLTYSLGLSFGRNHSCILLSEGLQSSGTDTAEQLPHRGQPEDTCVRALQEDASLSPNTRQLLRRVAECLPAAAVSRWDVEELALPSRLPAENRRYPFDPTGYGLATCIAEMKLGRGEHFEALRDAFCAQFPAFDDIIIQRSTVLSVERNALFQKHHGSPGEGYALVLHRKDGVEIPAGLASGGTLVTLAFLTLIHYREARKLLLIEEPENALHPGRLKEIVPLLRRAVTSHPDSQVILTTHSPLLLDYVDPAEVRVFLRNEQDDVEVYDVGHVPDIRERLKYLMLGELVYNEGEQELVKEIKQHASSHPG